MAVTYPLFVFEKDCQSIRKIEHQNEILRHLEAIDVENDEYVLWDANGDGVSVTVSVTAFRGELKDVTSCAPAFPLRDAFALYAKTLGISEAVAEGTPVDAWRRIQGELDSRPKKRSFFSRMFSSRER